MTIWDIATASSNVIIFAERAANDHRYSADAVPESQESTNHAVYLLYYGLTILIKL